MKTLILPIKKKWFDMISSGEKKEEYREIKPYYQTRFDKPLTHVKFTNGYGNSVPSVTVELLGISKGVPKPEWSEGTIEQGSLVFVLSLGKIVAPLPDDFSPLVSQLSLEGREQFESDCYEYFLANKQEILKDCIPCLPGWEITELRDGQWVNLLRST